MEHLEREIHIPKYAITADSDLTMLVVEGKEGIGSTFSTKLSFDECERFIDIEDESIPERERLQRNADKGRVNGIRDYLINRDNTFFPSVILVVSSLELVPVEVGFGEVRVHKATLKANVDRLLIDGQGRLTGIRQALKVRPELASHHLDVKIVVLNTAKIRDSAKFVTQIFADLHLNLKKPNASQSIWFDSETNLNRLTNDVLETTERMGIPFADSVAVNGKLSCGQIFTLANVTDFISIMAASSTSKKSVNAVLNDTDNYDLYRVLVAQYIQAIYHTLPLQEVHDADDAQWKSALNNQILLCAIGLKALAWVGRSIIEDALANDRTQLDFTPLNKLHDLPLSDKANELWLKKGIFNKDVDGKIKIVKGSEKRLAAVLCQSIRLLPAAELV
ncbi:DNA sulfur modification protein DndB [Shewanella aestuarii]|uniref:DGQHR domain-containing protein n=1 Tax=Shewanella aestuarii TaxID=1028752 RepID=A0A6G9QSB1_9GAMM|nr:DNA sulfur modification protein DndB [Shewanella aestuarii]QIR16661.1 DGQHR domain-containing protein [Shewanella aestuarii]